MPDQLIRIEADQFVAGADIENGIIIEAAPILSQFIGRDANILQRFAEQKGWKVEVLDPEPIVQRIAYTGDA